MRSINTNLNSLTSIYNQNRLQLEYHSTIMSVEQVYLLLLGEEASTKFNEYLVYSHLTRVGYILVRHQNVAYYDDVEPTEVDCAWALALSDINNRGIPENIKKSKYYAKVKKQMKLIKDRIQEQQQIEEVKETGDSPLINFQRKIAATGKRKEANNKAENPTEAKRRRLEMAARQRSLLDCLKDEPEYKEFEAVFAKFDIIQMADACIGDADDVRTLPITFDLYLHNTGFKKSTPTPPTFRIIILGVEEQFPTHAEISHTYNLQKYPIPLLIVSVGESKQIQAFIYYFS
ncbi:uncharacterized protein Tsen54 [Eurosta solidaginis]|uniref:uncharacterized protein Tsen54 n=1 Tax=Eurosta solidaginis TaxID=178769 RepID=UPI0035313F1A